MNRTQAIYAVQFEVHDTVDHAGYLRDNIVLGRELDLSTNKSIETKSVFVEALASAANDVGLVIGKAREGRASAYRVGIRMGVQRQI